MNAFVETTLHNKIKNKTGGEHERLRNLLIELDLFKNLEQYKKFTLAQYNFHCVVEDLFIEHDINELIPNIKCTERLITLRKDLEDLHIHPEGVSIKNTIISNRYEALGWLYVSEGSTLGAAMILKGVKSEYGLSENFGARNLGEYPEGRAIYWANFTDGLNKLHLNLEEEKALINGVFSAFKTFGLMLENLE